MRRATVAPLLGIALATALPAVAQDDPGSFARELSALRTEVEQLSETLQLEREALRSDLRASELRRAELEARIRQEELRLSELQREVERQREVISADDVAHEHLVPMLKTAIARYREVVRSGLPYRQDARIGAFDEIEAKLDEGTLDPRRAVGRLWTLVEDELRLTRENIMDRQVVALDGEEVLVDVARIGMVALFFRTEDGRYGRAVPAADGWVWTRLDDGTQVAQLTELFDALEKQVRVGWFDLPWALPEVAS